LSSANRALLKVEGLEKRFGGITALTDYCVEIRQGELVGLIGANGAGKTSMLRTISGLLRPESGRILYKPHGDGEEIDISRVSAERIVALGISHCPEGRGIFSRLSVRENLMVGAYLRKNKQAIEQDYSRICGAYCCL